MVKKLSANARDIEMRVPSLGLDDPLERGMASTPYLPGESHRQRRPADYSP